MPCFLVLFALLTPRILLAMLWFTSAWVRGVFDTLLIPVVGFIFLPTTLLWYLAVQRFWGGEWTMWPVVGLVVALLIDVSPASGKRR